MLLAQSNSRDFDGPKMQLGWEKRRAYLARKFLGKRPFIGPLILMVLYLRVYFQRQ
jgi:hypothetical protein